MRLRKALTFLSVLLVIVCLLVQNPVTQAANRKGGGRRNKPLPEAVNVEGVAATHANVRYPKENSVLASLNICV